MAQVNIKSGTCYLLLAFDIAQAVRLDLVERDKLAATRAVLVPKQRGPKYLGYSTPPLELRMDCDTLKIGRWQVAPRMSLALFDFGAITLQFEIPLSGSLDDLGELSQLLYENEDLYTFARNRLDQFLSQIQPALIKPLMVDFVEDYYLFQITSEGEGAVPSTLLDRHSAPIAQILRGEAGVLSRQEERDAVASVVSYSDSDILFLDWHAALIFNYQEEDVLTVLAYANMALLEMRFLDSRLDAALDQSYEWLSRGTLSIWSLRIFEKEMRKIGQLQADAALLFENVNNALKIVGDQYLARVYKLATQRFFLKDWDENITRKLASLESIYEKVSDQVTQKRMEILELTIILLFIFDILLAWI